MTAYVTRDAPPSLRGQSWSDAVEWVTLPVGLSTARLHVVAQFTALPLLALRRRHDVLHSPANIGPVRVPGIACVVTLHDLIWRRYPEQWESVREARSLERVVRPCARGADRIVAISRAAADDLVATLGIPRGKLDVTPLGVTGVPDVTPTPPSALRERLGLADAPIVLCVSQKRPYKNLGALVRALAGADDLDAQLILPGTPTPHEGELRALAAELGVAGRVHFPDWVSEEDLEGLYAMARCFVLPSRLEGFGLPVLEAMARGVPVACSARGSLPEVAGDAALLFDPDDQAAVDAAVRRLLADDRLARDLAERGRRRAESFTWERTARGTLAAYRRALAARGRR